MLVIVYIKKMWHIKVYCAILFCETHKIKRAQCSLDPDQKSSFITQIKVLYAVSCSTILSYPLQMKSEQMILSARNKERVEMNKAMN